MGIRRGIHNISQKKATLRKHPFVFSLPRKNVAFKKKWKDKLWPFKKNLKKYVAYIVHLNLSLEAGIRS